MSVRRSLAWAFTGQFLSFAVSFGGSIVIARLLSPRELGTYAIAMAALGIIQAFASFGIGAYVVRDADLAPGTLESAFTVNAAVLIALTLALVAVSFVSGPLLGVPEAGAVLRVIAISNLLGIANFRPTAMLQRVMKFREMSLITVTNGLVQNLSTIGFALAGLSFMSPAYATLATSVVTTSLTMILGRQYNGFGVSLANWRPITRFGLQMVSVSGVGLIAGQVSNLVLGRVLGVAALGLYSRASTLTTSIFQNLYGTATRVVFAQLSKDYREGADWSGTFLRGFSMITAFMWPVVIGLSVLSRPTIYILYGERWLPAAWPLSALMISLFVEMSFGMNWELFVVRGEIGQQARYETSRLILGVPLFAIGCLFSPLGAALGKVCETVGAWFFYYPQVRRLANLGSSEIPAVYRSSLTLTAVAALPALMVMIRYDWSPFVPWPVLVAAVGAGMGLWLVVIVATRHPLRDEMVLVWRKLPLVRAAA